MTVGTVSISITINTGHSTRHIEKEIKINELEQAFEHLDQKMTGEVYTAVLEAMDDEIRYQVPDTWQNVGREPRSIVLAHGWVTFYRRIYLDEHGQRVKPLDVILGIAAYARNSLKVQEMGSVLASQTTYRQGAKSLSFMLKTDISPSSIMRMVWHTGQRIMEQEEAFRSDVPGKISAPVLYGESDGVWLHLQHEKERRKEVRVATVYTGKKPIGKDRYEAINKLVFTQLGGNTREWQIHLRELIDHTYRLSDTQLLVAGGDGNLWVRQSFDLLNLPQTFLLDRFHVVRALRRSFGRDLVIKDVKKKLFSEGFEAISGDLSACILKVRGKKKENMQDTYQYLQNHQDALIDLDKRGLPDIAFCKFGTIKGVVDKSVVHRMKGRGCSWRIPGAQFMLAVLRHLHELIDHSFQYPLIPPTGNYINQVKTAAGQLTYQPMSGSISLFHGGDQSKPWVQLLKHKLNIGLSLNSYL
jgi:hypothetical protein